MRKQILLFFAVLCVLLAACNGGRPVGDPVKEHRTDRRDTVASLFPGEEDLTAHSDSLDTDSITEE